MLRVYKYKETMEREFSSIEELQGIVEVEASCSAI
jgi:hypothetical protein